MKMQFKTISYVADDAVEAPIVCLAAAGRWSIRDQLLSPHLLLLLACEVP